MNELFGIPTTVLAIALSCLFGVALLAVIVSAVANPTMFRMGLRNLRRRGAQTVLVVVGLMLSTLIVTAAFITGDTIDSSLTGDTYEVFGQQDLDIAINERPGIDSDFGGTIRGEQHYAPETAVNALEAHFGMSGSETSDPDIAVFQPFLWELAPVVNPRTGMGVASVQLSGVDLARMASAGGLRIVGGGEATLAGLTESQVMLSESARDDLGARIGDVLQIHIGDEVREVTVVAFVRDEIASGVLGMSYSNVPPGVTMRLDVLQEWSGHPGEINAITVSLRGDEDTRREVADSAAARISTYLASPEGRAALGAGDRTIAVNAIKKDSIEQAEFLGNLFTTFFLLMGLFSMASGVMLIFMIFVMLAAERRSEMGMARAVGAQRGHLLQSFVSEGVTYSLLSGIVGAALGVGASIALTMGLMKAVGGEYFGLVQFDMSWKSIVIGYTLGVVLTFLTVFFSAIKVSRVNIVAAIRNLPDDGKREGRRQVRWRWVIAGLPAMTIPPLGIWWLFRKGLGLPWGWIIGPAGIVFGALFIMLGKSGEAQFPFALGISLVPLSAAALARHFRAPARPVWTAVGLLLLAYWLLPPAEHNRLFGEFNADIEMFFLSGVMLVAASTLVIIFNGNVLTALFVRGRGGLRAYRSTAVMAAAAVAFAVAGFVIGDRGDGLGQLSYLVAALFVPAALLAFVAARVPGLAPSLKMAVAYPLDNRFRTGMTIAMFSLIVFSITIFSILLKNFGQVVSGDEARGGIDVTASAAGSNPVTDVRGAIAGTPAEEGIVATGRTTYATGAQRVRQPGEETWNAYPVLAADETFLTSLKPELAGRAYGFADDAAVYQAIAEGRNLAIIDRSALLSEFSTLDWQVADVPVGDDNGFEAFDVEIRNSTTGIVETVTVIGVLKNLLDAQIIGGIYLSAASYEPIFGTPSYRRTFVQVADDADPGEVATAIESALAVRGVSADSVQELLDNAAAQQNAFNRMFQAFIGLGLVVGIAGLGVISFRSVVERRQQIGMLRAIGFQRGTVSLAFLLESSFIAVMGIVSGVVGGAILARNLLTSPEFTEGSTLTFRMPWSEVGILVALAYGCALLMTWLPSRNAARVPVADALRYE